MCASREGQSPMAVLDCTGPGPGMVASRVGHVNKEVKDAWTLSHLGITLVILRYHPLLFTLWAICALSLCSRPACVNKAPSSLPLVFTP